MAALAIVVDNAASEDDRFVAADELESALDLLRLPAGTPRSPTSFDP